MSEHAGLNQVRIRLALEQVTLTWDEANGLRRRARETPSCTRVADMLEAVGVSRPAMPTHAEKETIIKVVDSWVAEEEPPPGITKLYDAVMRDLGDSRHQAPRRP